MSEDGTCICGITSNQKLFIQNWTTKLNKEYEISDTVIDFFKFPKQSKVMIRRREAGLGLFDQISNLHQHLYISNTGDFVIFVSRKGVIFFDVASNKWKQVSNFKNEIHFEFDVKFEYQNEVTAAIKIILGMKQRIGRYSDKLEIQYTILDVSREVQSIKIANLIHVIKVPFEFMDQPDSSITQPLIMKILKEKWVIWVNYSDNSLEHSKLFLIHRPEEQTVMAVPLLPELIDGASSTSRSVFVKSIERIKLSLHGAKNSSDSDEDEWQNLKMEYSKNPLERTQMFTLLLSNGEFLVYSEFDGRMIQVLSKEILSQNKFQNRTLLRVSL